MKYRCGLICGVMFFCSIPAFSQSSYSRLAQLYAFVDKADSISEKSLRTFYLEKFLQDDHNYKETWRYSVEGSKVVYFEVNYLIDSIEYAEVYYLDRGRLVCSEEYETVNYTQGDDELKWGGVFYFESTEPRHVVTLGRRSTATVQPPEDMARTRFSKRFSELKMHMPILPSR